MSTTVQNDLLELQRGDRAPFHADTTASTLLNVNLNAPFCQSHGIDRTDANTETTLETLGRIPNRNPLLSHVNDVKENLDKRGRRSQYVVEERKADTARRSTPEGTRQDLRILTRAAQDPKERDYWEIYWARRNILPNAARKILGAGAFKGWKEKRRDAPTEKEFDPDIVMTFRPEEDEDPHDWPLGPHEWVESIFLQRENPFIEGAKLEMPKQARDYYELHKERDIKKASDVITAKYFGRRFYGEQYSEFLDKLLRKTMYGTELDLAEIYPYAATLEYLLKKLKSAKTERDVKKIKDQITNTFWKMALDLNRMDAQRETVDPLQTEGSSWRITRRRQIIAKAGPKALADGLNLRTEIAEAFIKAERQAYKEKQKGRSAVLKRIETVVRKTTGFSLESDDNPHHHSHMGIHGKTDVLQEPPGVTAAAHLRDALLEAKAKKGQLTEEDVEKAVKKALKRAAMERAFKSMGTPKSLTDIFHSAVRDTFKEFWKKYGFDPRIATIDDAITAMQLTKGEIEDLIKSEPKYYYKGYVLAKLRRAKEFLKRAGIQ